MKGSKKRGSDFGITRTAGAGGCFVEVNELAQQEQEGLALLRRERLQQPLVHRAHARQHLRQHRRALGGQPQRALPARRQVEMS